MQEMVAMLDQLDYVREAVARVAREEYVMAKGSEAIARERQEHADELDCHSMELIHHQLKLEAQVLDDPQSQSKEFEKAIEASGMMLPTAQTALDHRLRRLWMQE